MGKKTLSSRKTRTGFVASFVNAVKKDGMIPLALMVMVILVTIMAGGLMFQQSITSSTNAAGGCRRICKEQCNGQAAGDCFDQCKRDCEEGKDPAHPEDYNMGPNQSCINDCVNGGTDADTCAANCQYYAEHGCWPDGKGGCVTPTATQSGNSPTPKPLTTQPFTSITPLPTTQAGGGAAGGRWKTTCELVTQCALNCPGGTCVYQGEGKTTCCITKWIPDPTRAPTKVPPEAN